MSELSSVAYVWGEYWPFLPPPSLSFFSTSSVNKEIRVRPHPFVEMVQCCSVTDRHAPSPSVKIYVSRYRLPYI